MPPTSTAMSYRRRLLSGGCGPLSRLSVGGSAPPRLMLERVFATLGACWRCSTKLDQALAELAAVDTLTDTELQHLVVGVQSRRDRLGAVAARPMQRWDSRGVWLGDGSRSAASRLARECRSSVRSAKIELRRARQLASMPATAAAVADGRLSLDHVDLLGRANQSWRGRQLCRA